ncbi:MAG TPA: cysteine desulfurase family protein [Acidimicrobiales bacterium]|nr:cysteine desulfurase family protein [Acidimicrobiales bacterium]
MVRHYLDHASTCPLRPEAARAITGFLERGIFADPSRPYEEGRVVAEAIEEARDAVAALVSVSPRQVIFTSGGTESANWANWAARVTNRAGPIVFSPVEHSAVRRSAERHGPVSSIPVDHFGRVDLDTLDSLLAKPDALPALVNCQFANHQVGTVQPIREVVARCHRLQVPVHVDACMAIGQMRVDLAELDANYVSLSAHKFGGPTGIGALVVGRGTRVPSLLLGGAEERARRAGMESVISIVGLGAVARALAEPGTLEAAAGRARALTDSIAAAALSVPDVVEYGDPIGRVPQLVCFGVPGVKAEGVVMSLDQAGVAVHSGSACASEAFKPSPALAAMGVDADRSLRCSVGWSTNEDDVAAFAIAFPSVVGKLRSLA